MRTDIERLDVIVGGIDAPPVRSDHGERGPAATGQRYDPGLEGPGPEEVQQRVVTVTLIALAGLALGIFGLMMAGGGDIGWMLFAIALLSGVIVLYKNFEAGIIIFLSICWIAVRSPSLGVTGAGFSARLLLGQMGLSLLLLIFVMRILVRLDFTFYSTPINVPMVLVALTCLWSTMNAYIFPDPKVLTHSFRIYTQVNYYEVLVRILSFGALVLIANTLQGRMLRWASLVVVAPGILTFSGLLSFIPSTMFMAFPQTLSMAILVSFALTYPGRLWMRVAAGAIGMSIFCTYFLKGTEWVSGWMGGLMALLVILFLTRRRLLWLLCAVLAMTLLLNWEYFYFNLYTMNFAEGTFDNGRVQTLRAAFLYAAKFPLGVGLGNYRSYNAYYGRADVWDTTTLSSAHGTYTQALTETGWPGLLVLLLFMAASTRMLYRYWKALPEGGYARSYVLGVLGGSVGVYAASFNGDYIFPAYHNAGISSFGSSVYLFFFIGIAMAMAREAGLVWSEIRGQARTGRPSGEPQARPQPIINRPLRGGTGTAAPTAAEPR